MPGIPRRITQFRLAARLSIGHFGVMRKNVIFTLILVASAICDAEQGVELVTPYERIDVAQVIHLKEHTPGDKAELVIRIGQSERKENPFISVIYSYGMEAILHEVVSLEHGHSPYAERKGNHVLLLFTAGTNTTCVAKIGIEEGIPRHLSTETIAWNDSGVYRTSDSFSKYKHLLKSESITSWSGTTAKAAPVLHVR